MSKFFMCFCLFFLVLVVAKIYDIMKEYREFINTIEVIIIKDGEVEIDTLNLDKLFSAISIVESQNNPNAVGDDGNARGIIQIHEVCIKDINNRCYGYDKYTWDDAFCPDKSKKMFMDYSKWIIKNRGHKYPSLSHEELIAKHWNGGYNFYNKQSTIHYWDKVQKELEKNS